MPVRNELVLLSCRSRVDIGANSKLNQTEIFLNSVDLGCRVEAQLQLLVSRYPTF